MPRYNPRRNGSPGHGFPNHDAEYLVLGLALFWFKRVGSNFLVVLLEGSEIFTGLAELALFHTLADVPVDEGTLAAHEVELMVQSRPRLGDGSCVGQHRDGAVDAGEAAIRRGGRGDSNGLLVVDADLEASRAPLDEVEGGLGLEGSHSRVAVTRDHIAAVQQGDSHVLAVARVANDHLVVRFKAWADAVRRRSHGQTERDLHWKVKSWTLKLSWALLAAETTGA